MMNMPFSQACENNRGPILKVIKPLLADKHRVLEIGSGTGQHAAWFAQHMPHLIWQTSDVLENHWGIKQWIASNPSENLPAPLELNIFQENIPAANYDAIFTANTAHIMPWEGVERLFDCLAVQLPTQGIFCLYGPMGYNGLISPESNIQFDQFLQRQSSHRGIRQFEAVNALAISAGLELLEDFALPANNRLIAWQKTWQKD